MILWSAIFALAALVAAIMIYAGLGKISRPKQVSRASSEEHFRVQLAEIESDARFSRLNPVEAEESKAEIARELMRQRAANTAGDNDANEQVSQYGKLLKFALPITSVMVFALAIGIYLLLGSPEQPDVPYVAHVAAVEKNQANFNSAITKVEKQLQADPTDVRGWRVIGPAYMQARRYPDAIAAFRKVLELSPAPTADEKTDLAEALMMNNSGTIIPEAITLLKSAADMDKTHVRSRFYLASEATRSGKWDKAIALWKELIALSDGSERWLEIAMQGLNVAEARGVPDPSQSQAGSAQSPAVTSQTPGAAQNTPAQDAVIRNMVDGLATRLAQDGGTLAEWTRLVRSQLVLGETEKARQSYLEARAAYPDATKRSQLDNMAAQAGILEANAPDVTLK
ncbi:Cytochrome c heme lyase subunit CcmH [hydrothermal vent metagenome]|uniref:Cytochrome c heme lyase subunit CcmH n=1 Tax=hydrothermal vent metagenome TaxID=652676 RepID=A0A3B0TS47_9ZZZZ